MVLDSAAASPSRAADQCPARSETPLVRAGREGARRELPQKGPGDRLEDGMCLSRVRNMPCPGVDGDAGPQLPHRENADLARGNGYGHEVWIVG